MADYFTSFSCLFDVKSAANALQARNILNQFEKELEEVEGAALSFAMRPEEALGLGALCLFSEEDGDPEQVINFVKRCAEAFGLTGRWGFRWAYTCSKPLRNGFGGGAHILDLATGETVEWLDCEHWLTARLAAAHERQRGALA